MRIIKKEKQLKEVEVENYLVCDKCGNRIQKRSSFDAFECEFSYRTGDIYPEGGDVEEFKLDLCRECGDEAIKLLKDFGFGIQEYRHD